MKKRILVYAHYFYPDVASTGQILTELFEGLQDDFDITVIAAVPSYDGKVSTQYQKNRIYREVYKNITILRVRVPEFDKKNKKSRVKNIIAYFFNAIIATIKSGEQDVIFTISQPPILGGVLGIIGKILKKAKLIYNIQDFNPEQVEAVGYSKNKLLIEFARKIDKLSCKASNKVIVVGRDMHQKLVERFNNKNVPDSEIINNWIDEKEIYPLEPNHQKVVQFKHKYNLNNKFIFMYSGNIGLYYDLENIIKVIAKFKDRDNVIFAFVGDGNMKQTLVEYCNDNELRNVKFIPYQKKEELIYSLNAADVHIVTNAKAIKGISVPSKTYGVMASGKSIIGVLEKGSEARLIIEEANCGVCTEPNNYEDIYNKIEYILDNKEKVIKLGINGRRYLEKNLLKETSILKYKETILSV